MTDLRTAAQQALEALEYHVEQTRPIWKTSEAIAALEAALAEPQHKPQPWVGLTEEERTDICDDYGANIHWRAFRAIEAKLQEKNA